MATCIGKRSQVCSLEFAENLPEGLVLQVFGFDDYYEIDSLRNWSTQRGSESGSELHSGPFNKSTQCYSNQTVCNF